MPSQQLLDYIEECKSKNIPDQEIVNNLINSGWDQASIDLAFENFVSNPAIENQAATEQANIVKPAGSWGRFWAFFIDGLICGTFSYLLIVLSSFTKLVISPGTVLSIVNIVITLITLIFYLSYFVYFTSKKGATIGKDMYGFKVVKYKTGELLSFSAAIKREIFKVLYLLPLIGTLFYIIIGLSIIISKEKRGIPDHIVDTQELSVKKAWSIKKQISLFFLLFSAIIILFVINSTLSIKALTATTSKTSGQNSFKTFIDTVDGWTVKFNSSEFNTPIISTPRNGTNGTVIGSNEIDFNSFIPGSCVSAFNISWEENNNQPFNQWISNWITREKSTTGVSRITNENININGINGTKLSEYDTVTYSDTGNKQFQSRQVIYFLPNKNKIFELNYSVLPINYVGYNQQACSKEEEAIQKTFNTFKPL